MDIQEFKDGGFLQEVNRQFLHPLGLALEIRKNEEGEYELGGIWDYRDDPEGILYDEGVLNWKKLTNVSAEYHKHAPYRIRQMGDTIQKVPVPNPVPFTNEPSEFDIEPETKPYKTVKVRRVQGQDAESW